MLCVPVLVCGLDPQEVIVSLEDLVRLGLATTMSTLKATHPGCRSMLERRLGLEIDDPPAILALEEWLTAIDWQRERTEAFDLIDFSLIDLVVFGGIHRLDFLGAHRPVSGGVHAAFSGEPEGFSDDIMTQRLFTTSIYVEGDQGLHDIYIVVVSKPKVPPTEFVNWTKSRRRVAEQSTTRAWPLVQPFWLILELVILHSPETLPTVALEVGFL